MSSHKKKRNNKKSSIKPSSSSPASLISPNDKYANKYRNTNYSISFSGFDDKESCLDIAKASHCRKFIKLLIGLCNSKNKNDFHDKCVADIKPINNSGDYKRFFRDTEPGEIVYEADITDMRAFFCILPDKIIQIIALVGHPETNKNRR